MSSALAFARRPPARGARATRDEPVAPGARVRQSMKVLRCELHHLACGPDGRCVVCRRQPPSPGPSAGSRLGAIAVVVALVAGVAAAARGNATRANESLPVSGIIRWTAPSGATPSQTARPVALEIPTSQDLPRAGLSDEGTSGEKEKLQGLLAMAKSAASAPPGRDGVAAPEPSAIQPALDRALQALTASDVHVVMYSTSWCPVCKRAKAWMVARGLSFDELDVEASSENARRLREVNPRGGVPTFDVDGDVVVGFDERRLVDALQRASGRQSPR